VTTVLELADVTFRRDGKQIIDGISMTVNAGEHWALLGPNGAGKSTLLGFCAAVTFPSSGTVRVLGEQMGRVDLARLRHSIGHVNPRHRLQYSLTVREVVLTGITATIDIPMRWTPSQDELERADAMIESVGLPHKADAHWPTLSQGERGRSLIARALVSEPRLLLLDEPTTGLDPQSRRQLWDVVLGFKSRGRTVLLTTHYMDEAERLCDRVAVVDRGKVIALGTPAELIASLGGQQVIVAQLDGAVADGELSGLPGVHRLSRAGGSVSLAVEKLHQTLPALLALAQARGAALTQLSTHQATLEDVFVTLTGRQLRE